VRKISTEEMNIKLENYGLGGDDEMVKFDDLANLMKQKMIAEFLIGELKEKGLGNDLVKEAEE
jgi:hypothetical protein